MDVSDYYYEGSIPFITRTDSNNGCNGYVQKDMVEDIEKGNALIIGDTTSTCFYQKDDFITGGHIIIFSKLLIVSILFFYHSISSIGVGSLFNSIFEAVPFLKCITLSAIGVKAPL